ncbi:response regulator [Paenibacillus alkalitolerans]|uniref:response regulator n=1 Tax=Paenibacillus alkalitolerans TaxID=2799335 RepID=UPI0018F3ACBC
MSYSVLIVDDTNFMRKMSADYLKQFGYTVAGEAANGREAVELYVTLKPHIVMMDLTMPEMNGIEAIKEIMKIDPKAVVLVCSASNQQDLIFDALDAGAKGYIMKPFKPDRMNEIIRKYAVPYLAAEAIASRTVHTPEDDDVSLEIAATTETVLEDRQDIEGEADVPDVRQEVQQVQAVHEEEEVRQYNPAEEKPMEQPRKSRPSFVTSYMCNWDEEINGSAVTYHVVCTENENKMLVEMHGENQEKQAIQFSLDGFRELIHWLDKQLADKRGVS